MLYIYRVVGDQNLVHERLKGDCSVREIEEAIIRLFSDSDFRADYDIVTDLRDARFSFRPADYEPLLKMVRTRLRGGQGRTAIIVHTPHETAMSSIYQQAIEDVREVRVFSTAQAAVRWLQVAPTVVYQI